MSVPRSFSLSTPFRPRGFTILESLVVLGVLAIMTMMIIALWLRKDPPPHQPSPAAEIGLMPEAEGVEEAPEFAASRTLLSPRFAEGASA